MAVFLTILNGFGWFIVYEEYIQLGVKQRIFAMFFWALGSVSLFVNAPLHPTFTEVL